MGLRNWDLKDDRERTPFDYVLPSGAWFQTKQAAAQLYEGERDTLVPAEILHADVATGLELFMFGQDYPLVGWCKQAFKGIAALPPTPTLYPNPEHFETIMGMNDLTKISFVTASRNNWGNKEVIQAKTVTNETVVIGYAAQVFFVDRGFVDAQATPLKFTVEFDLAFSGAGLHGIPRTSGAPASGEEEAVPGLRPAIIPEAAYDDTVRANNHFIQSGNDVIYVAGLWQGAAL